MTPSIITLSIITLFIITPFHYHCPSIITPSVIAPFHYYPLILLPPSNVTPFIFITSLASRIIFQDIFAFTLNKPNLELLGAFRLGQVPDSFVIQYMFWYSDHEQC